MRLFKKILDHLRRTARQGEDLDMFTLRLMRIGLREKRHAQRAALFRTALEPAAA